jgi:hypothetical protein
MSEERFVIQLAEGKFAVIAGRKLNDEPLSRAAADRLAKGSPVKPLGAKAPEAPPPPPKRKPAGGAFAPGEPQPAPAVDLRPTRADNAGGVKRLSNKGLAVMVIARDEIDEVPEARDPLGVAISQVIACIFEELPADCAERKAALCTIIEAHTRVAALLHRPRLN